MKEGDSREGSPSADPGTPILVRIEEAHRVVMEAEEGEVLASSLEVTSPRMNYNASKNMVRVSFPTRRRFVMHVVWQAAAMMGEKLLEAAQVQLVAKTVAAITNRKALLCRCSSIPPLFRTMLNLNSRKQTWPDTPSAEVENGAVQVEGVHRREPQV